MTHQEVGRAQSMEDFPPQREGLGPQIPVPWEVKQPLSEEWKSFWKDAPTFARSAGEDAARLPATAGVACGLRRGSSTPLPRMSCGTYHSMWPAHCMGPRRETRNGWCETCFLRWGHCPVVPRDIIDFHKAPLRERAERGRSGRPGSAGKNARSSEHEPRGEAGRPGAFRADVQELGPAGHV